jgi:tripartite-type tricarboxylate transporter receptor subunit TctC
MKKIIFTALLLVASLAHADITLIIPFSPGGTYDSIGRRLSVFLTKELKEPVVVTNVLGAGGYIAVTKLESSNEKTILLTGSAFYRSLLDNNVPVDNFNYISVLGESPLFLGVTKSSGLTCDKLKDTNKNYFLGTSGVGSMSAKATAIVHEKYPHISEVPYKGSGQMVTDMLSGQIAGTFYNSMPDRPDIVLIANTSLQTSYGVPSITECFGIQESLKTQYLLIGNKQATSEFMRNLNNLLIQFTKDLDTIEHFKLQGITPSASTLKNTQTSVSNEYNKWKIKDKQ